MRTHGSELCAAGCLSAAIDYWNVLKKEPLYLSIERCTMTAKGDHSRLATLCSTKYCPQPLPACRACKHAKRAKVQTSQTYALPIAWHSLHRLQAARGGADVPGGAGSPE